MKRLILLFFAFSLSGYSHAQKDLLTAKTKSELTHNLDSAMHSDYFITPADAKKILGKPVHLKDGPYKFSSGVLRYSFNYAVDYKDSSSKGCLYFDFEQYRDTSIAKSNYEFIKGENQKEGMITDIKDLGNNAFLKEDNLNQPFILVLEDNKLYKFRILYLTSDKSLKKLVRAAKKVTRLH